MMPVLRGFVILRSSGSGTISKGNLGIAFLSGVLTEGIMVEFPGSAMAGTPEHSTKGHTMSLSPEVSAAPSEEPFPLKRRFLRGFVPAFFGFIVVLLILTGT
ncbi:MAG: hypothetical protein VW709_19905, partial [Rickettsiales bacterium]